MARDTGSLLSFRPSIKVMDATMRDGGLVNNFRFSDEWVRALVSANMRAGVDYMELGYKSDRDLFDENKFGKWKFCRDEGVFNVLGGVPEGLKLACMADVGRCNYERDIGPRENSPFSMYRIATYINTIPAALAMAEHCHKMGYETAVNIMAISKATEKELSLALDLIGNSPADVIYIVDSYGSIYPEEVRVIAEKVRESHRHPRAQQSGTCLCQHHRMHGTGGRLSRRDRLGHGKGRRQLPHGAAFGLFEEPEV